MADFTVDNIWDLDGYDPNTEGLAADFSWFCLSHNFDVVATILTMADVSWNKGFDAGRAVASICENWESVQGIEDPGN